MPPEKVSWYKPRNCFCKKIGKVKDAKGRDVYKRFYLGSDEKRAVIAATRLTKLWEFCRKRNGYWTDDDLALADVILKGGDYDATDRIGMLSAENQRMELMRLRRAIPDVQIVIDQNFLAVPLGVNLRAIVPVGVKVRGTTDRLMTESPSLQEAWDAYADYLRQSDKQDLWRNYCLQSIERLKQWRADLPIADLGYAAIDELGQWLRSLPTVKMR